MLFELFFGRYDLRIIKHSIIGADTAPGNQRRIFWMSVFSLLLKKGTLFFFFKSVNSVIPVDKLNVLDVLKIAFL